MRSASHADASRIFITSAPQRTLHVAIDSNGLDLFARWILRRNLKGEGHDEDGLGREFQTLESQRDLKRVKRTQLWDQCRAQRSWGIKE